MKKEELIDIFQTIEQANNMEIMFFSRISLEMDLSVAHQEFNLRLKALLNSNDINFAHNIIDIQDHTDKENRRMGDGFLPRYSGL